MLTAGPAFLAESYRARACARRRSVQHLRNHPHSIRSANTRSRDPDRRVHRAASTPAMATETATADAVEANIKREPPRGTTVATSTAGRTTTEAVVNTTSGMYRSKRVGAESSLARTPPVGFLHRLRATLRSDENSSKGEN